jgi:hypothetical protein
MTIIRIENVLAYTDAIIYIFFSFSCFVAHRDREGKLFIKVDNKITTEKNDALFI